MPPKDTSLLLLFFLVLLTALLRQPSYPLRGIAQKVFDLGARHRVVRQCRDMHATLCRLAILTRVTQDISVGVARSL